MSRTSIRATFSAAAFLASWAILTLAAGAIVTTMSTLVVTVAGWLA